MWNSFFSNIQKKYSMKLSTKQPLIVRFDGKDVTKNANIDLLDLSKNSFYDNLKKTSKYFTEKYNCLAIFGSDEISFIIEKPNTLLKDLSSDSTNFSNEVISVFSQYFFQYFSHFDSTKIIFWHGKCFSIPKGKEISYIKYRARIIENVITTYFLKRKGIPNCGVIPLEERLNMCKTYKDYSKISNIKNGTLIFNGNEIDLKEYYNGNIVKIDNIDESIFDNIL